MHLYKDDHIKYSPLAEDHATLGWSADGWVPLQPWGHLDIVHLSQRPVHSGAKQGSFPFLLAVLLWSWQTRPKKQKAPLLTAASRPQPATCQQGSHQSVCPFVHQHCVRVSSFCVGVFYSALPLFKSTVATGQSLGIGKSEGFHGFLRVRHKTYWSPGWLAFRGLFVCV